MREGLHGLDIPAITLDVRGRRLNKHYAGYTIVTFILPLVITLALSSHCTISVRYCSNSKL